MTKEQVLEVIRKEILNKSKREGVYWFALIRSLADAGDCINYDDIDSISAINYLKNPNEYALTDNEKIISDYILKNKKEA